MEINKQHSLKEYILKCPICYEYFNFIHKPNIIPCGHTICSICCQNLKKISEEEDDEEYHSSEELLDITLDSGEENEENHNHEESEDNEEHEDGEESENDNENNENENESDENDNEIVRDFDLENHNNENLNLFANQSNNLFSDKNKKFKLKCSICRKKMKISEDDIIVNQQIMKIIEKIEKENEKEIDKENETVKESNSNIIFNPNENNKNINSNKNGKRVFCKICRFIDTEINHLSQANYNTHKSELVSLDNNKFEEIKNNLSNQIFSVDDKLNLNSKSVELISNFINSSLDKDNEKLLKETKEYLQNYYNVNSKANYLYHKSFRKLAALYESFNQIKEEIKEISSSEPNLLISDIPLVDKNEANTKINLKIQEAEKILQGADKLTDKYISLLEPYKKNYEKILNQNSILVSNSILEKSKKILGDGLFESYSNGITDYERRFAVCAESSNEFIILLYDCRMGFELQIKYENIFKEIIKNLSENQNHENLYTPNIEIDDTGRYMYLMGKRDKNSKKFYIYDLNVRKLTEKNKIPIKFHYTDKYFYNKKLFIIGGQLLDETPISDCFYYDSEADWWESLPDLKLKKYNKSIAIVNNKIYSFGGTPKGAEEENREMIYKFEMLNLNSMFEDNFSWEVFTVKNYRYFIQNAFYAFVNSNTLIILGGEDNSTYEENLKGFIIDMQNRELLEEFKIKQSLVISNNVCSYFRGMIIGASQQY